MRLKGKKISPDAVNMSPGDYWQVEGLCWYGLTPNGLVCSLAGHKVIENSDNTITVEPSILVKDGWIQWHGYLTNGVWKEC